MTGYPSAIKAFYLKPHPDRPEVSLSVDFLAPEGYGEIIGGGQRLDDYDLLLKRIEEHKLPREAFEWYLDLRRFGSVPHAASAWASSASCPGSAASITCAKRFRIRECCTGCIREIIARAIDRCKSSIGLRSIDRSVMLMKIGFVSLGCPKNLVDGEVMLGLAREAGHEITADAASADVIVVNTCAFIDTRQGRVGRRDPRDGASSSATAIVQAAGRHRLSGRALPRSAQGRDSRDRRRARHGRSAGDRRRARRHRSRSPTPMTLVRASTQAAGSAGRTPDRRTSSRRIPTYLYDASTPRLLTTPRHYAYVKVAEGCDYTCAFCIIPTLRGKYRSRDEDSIVAEAEALAAAACANCC